MTGMKIGDDNCDEMTTTSRTFQIRDRFAMCSLPSAARPAHASWMLSKLTCRCLSPPLDAMPDSSRHASMNDSAMYSALLPVLMAANPMKIVKMRNAMPTLVSLTTPSNSKLIWGQAYPFTFFLQPVERNAARFSASNPFFYRLEKKGKRVGLTPSTAEPGSRPRYVE